MTAQDVVYRSLRHCVAQRPGYQNSPELMGDCLEEWRVLWDSWNLDPRYMPRVPQTIYPFPVNGGYLHTFRDFQIGPGAADFNGPRPVKILKANLLYNSNPATRIPLAIRNWRDYGSISVLTVPATQVTTELYYEPAFPLGIIHCWPPVTAGPRLEFWAGDQLVAPASLATVIGAPGTNGVPQYDRTLLLYSLAAGNRIAPDLVAQGTGNAATIRAVLSVAIASDLTVRINLDGAPFATMTIPQATGVGVALAQPFASPAPLITAGQVLSFDVLAGDGSTNPNGLVSFTLEWGPAYGGVGETTNFPPGVEEATVFSLAEKVQYLCPKEIRRPNPKLAAWALKARQYVRNLNALNPRGQSDYPASYDNSGGKSTSGNLTLIGSL